MPIAIPGVKLGLSNVITLYAIFTMRPQEALAILISRILLGSFFVGNLMVLLYSLGGGLLCFAVTVLLTKVLKTNQMFIASIIGAVFHNIGQILVAALVLKSFAVFSYLPVLLVSGVIVGAFTGFAAQYLTMRLHKTKK